MAFEFTVTTTTPNETFTIPCQNFGTFNATIDWGDGGPTSSITTYNDADLAHTYASAGDHQISITGTFPNIYFNNGGDKLKVKSVEDLGDVGWVSLSRAFRGCSNMTSFTGGTADTSSATSMFYMFASCSSLTSLDVSSFNTSSVTSMGGMFQDCSSLTSLDISGFDTSSVTNMFYMFYNCSFLTSLDVSGFDTSSVTNMNNMFQSCSSLTSLDLSGFNTSSVTNMSYMFYNCYSLTSLDVSSFDTSSVTSMNAMFYNCSSLTSLDVSGFDTSSVTNMGAMFYNCTNLTGLQISGWDVSSVTNGTNFLLSANNALTTQEYNNTLVNWSQLSLQSGVTWHFGDATYDEYHPNTRYYLDFDGADDNLILDADTIAASSNATLYKTFRGDTTDNNQVMFGTNAGPYILAAAAADGGAALSNSVGSPVYREDGITPSYATKGDIFTALIDNTDHTIGVEEVDLSAAGQWASNGFYIGGEYSATFDNTGRLYAWAAVDTRLDGRGRDLLENFMIGKKTS